MEAIFNLVPKDGKIPIPEDLFKYLKEKDGVAQTITLKDTVKLSEKMQMYAYLFGPVMTCAVNAFTAAGYNGVDKVKARYMLEAELCKEEVYSEKKGKVIVYTESVGSMSKKRLHKFINDCLFFLELEFRQKVPDAEEWKVRFRTGRNFKLVSND